MRRVLLLAALLAVPVGNAYAWDNTNKGRGPQSIADGGPSQAQGQAQGQRQSASSRSAGGAGYGAGGSSSVNVSNGGGGGNGGGTSGAMLLAVPGNPGMGECIKGLGIGGAGEKVGGIISYAWHEATCKALREGQVFWADGLQDAAYGRWCQDDVLRKSLRGHCDDAPVPAVPVSAPGRAAYPFDYCGTRNPGDKNQHLECDQRAGDGG